MDSGQIEKFLADILKLDRDGLVSFLWRLDCDFQIDFTDEYLQGMSLERLQHLVAAVVLHANNLPEAALRAA